MAELIFPVLIGDHTLLTAKFEKVVGLSKPVVELAGEIATFLAPRPDAPVFINIETTSTQGYRQDHNILDVLLALRCSYRFPNPVICVGFEPLSSILNRRPEHLLLCSPGTKYLQLPLPQSHLSPGQIPATRVSGDDFERLKKFLDGSHKIDRYRHSEANWWGIEIQWKMHTQLFFPDSAEAPPRTITEDDHALQHAIAKFLFMPPDAPAALKHPDTIELRDHVVRKRPRILHIDDQSKEGWAALFQYIMYDGLDLQRFRVLDIAAYDTIDTLITKLDDILRHSPQTPGFDVDLILLDVRLLPEQDDLEKEIKMLSGPRLLQHIRKNYLGIPVIITTASNKARTYQELMTLGADAYWMKQGLDEGFSQEENIASYHRLLRLTADVLNEEYRLLKTMAGALQQIQIRDLWWQAKNWDLSGSRLEKFTPSYKQGLRDAYKNLKRHTSASKPDLIGIYSDGVGLYRYFLSKKLLQTSFRLAAENNWFYYSSIMVHFGKALEDHPPDNARRI